MKFQKTNKIITLLILACLLMPLTTAYGAQPTTNPAQAGQTPSGIPFSELESRIDVLVAEHLGVSTPGVAIVVISEGEIIFSKGYGYANIEQSILIDPSTTIMTHGSIAKVFVWTAALQLVEQGLLNLDADINTYLSEEAHRQFAFEMPFTMRDLMNHSAGFAEVVHNFMFIEPLDWENVSVREMLLANQPPQMFAPSTAAAYSNWGTTLAAYVIENITGQSFVDFEMENIFVPVGMTNTLNEPHWSENPSFLQARTIGYLRWQGGFSEARIPHYGGFYSAGSTLGTAEDLARFIIALTPPAGESGILFDDVNTLNMLFSPSSLDPINRPMTYHGFLRYRGLVDAIGHGGDTAGSASNFAIVPEERFGWVVMTNASDEFDIRFGLTELLIGTPFDQVQQLSDNLPNATAVEGHFVPLRRFEGVLFGFMPYLNINQVTAIDENIIQLSIGGLGYATYLQVEPYVFQIISHSNPLFGSMFGELRFAMENGSVTHIHVPNSFDITPLPQGRTMPFLIAYLVVLVASVVFFVVMPIVILVRFLVRKIKGTTADNQTKFRFFSVGLLILGLVILVNNILGAMTGVANYGIFTSAGLNPHIIANYIFAGISAIVFLVSIFFFHKEIGEIKTKSKVLYGITAALLALFIFTLHNWNFFALL